MDAFTYQWTNDCRENMRGEEGQSLSISAGNNFVMRGVGKGELLNLPLGAEVSWSDWRLTGRIMDRSETSVTIVWSDGNRTIVSVSEAGIDDLAYELEVIEADLAKPVVVGLTQG